MDNALSKEEQLFQEMCKKLEEFQKPLPYTCWKTLHVAGVSFSRINGLSCLAHFLQDISPFYPLLCCQTIQDAVGQFDFTESNAKVTDKMLHKRTTYKKGQFLVTWSAEYVEFGKIVLVLIRNDAVHFLVSVYTAEFLPQYHLYLVKKDNGKNAMP